MRLLFTISAVVAAALCTASLAAATMRGMHPELGAKLAGMGEHGIVNLQSDAAKGRLCWTFELKATGLTVASVRDAHGMIVARLGSAYKPKSCATVAKKALELLESKPRSYWVWIGTKGHPGEVRGRLQAGMVHM